MAEEIAELELKIERYTGPEEPFEPEVIKRVELTLEKIPKEEYVYAPQPTTYPTPSVVVSVKKAVMLNIETSGLNPWESRILAIGVRDLSVAETDPIVFFNLDERQMLLDFLAYFEENVFEEMWGFNVAFDFRFIFAGMLRYRLQSSEYVKVELRDLRQIVAQVKEAFVYSPQQSGKLEDWTRYLLNMEKLYPQEELLKRWEEGKYADVVEFAKHMIDLEFLLWLLIRHSKGEITLEVPEEEESESPGGSRAVMLGGQVVCPACYYPANLIPGQTSWTCKACGLRNTI